MLITVFGDWDLLKCIVIDLIEIDLAVMFGRED